MQMRAAVFVLFVLIHNSCVVTASEGDRSPFYQNCVRTCVKDHCTDNGVRFTEKSVQHQDYWAALLRWTCSDECRYHCMWRTVNEFEIRGLNMPKFHGKWPFRRLYGIQEPASVFASLLNLAAHAYMHRKILKRFSIADTPMLIFWHIFTLICMNAWVWSAVFHARDTPFTEFMDYTCALAMVLALLAAALRRVFFHRPRAASLSSLLLAAYFVQHVRYLATGRVDYDYNMTVNIFSGLAGALVWLAWAIGHLYCTNARYVWRLAAFEKLSGACLLLELYDFAPVWRAWDAHAVWHLTTAILPLLFYRFVIDDLEYLRAQKLKEMGFNKIA